MAKNDQDPPAPGFDASADTLGESFTAPPPDNSPGPPDQRYIDAWEVTNPRSLINLLPEWAAKNVLVHHGRMPKLFSLTETELRRYLKTQYAMTNETDNMIRMRFWLEYDRVQTAVEDQMNLKNVFSGVISRDVFMRYFKNLYKCAWMLCPPANYMVQIDEALSFGLSKMREILGEETVRNGKVDVSLAKLQFQIWQKIDERKNGAITQRIEQRNLNLNLHRAVEGAVQEQTSDALVTRLKQLEKLEREALHLPIESGVVPVPPPSLAMAEPGILISAERKKEN